MVTPVVVSEYIDDSPTDWVGSVPAISDGMPPTGGPVDLANRSGIANMPVQGVARRTAWLRSVVEARYAEVGVAVLSGGFGFSHAGDLVSNRTPSPITPTGTTLAALVADGFTDEGVQSSAMAAGMSLLASPVFPHVETADGRMPISNQGGGTIRIDAGISWVWRGGRRIHSQDHQTTARTFTTTASKLYHLRWHAPGTGIAIPASTYPVGRFELKDMSGLTETASQYDSTFDRMLIALITTDGLNVPTIKPLRNAARIDSLAITAGTITSNLNANATSFTAALRYDLARTPDVLPTFEIARGAGSDDNDSTISVSGKSRYTCQITGIWDYADNITVHIHYWAE